MQYFIKSKVQQQTGHTLSGNYQPEKYDVIARTLFSGRDKRNSANILTK